MYQKCTKIPRANAYHMHLEYLPASLHSIDMSGFRAPETHHSGHYFAIVQWFYSLVIGIPDSFLLDTHSKSLHAGYSAGDSVCDALREPRSGPQVVLCLPLDGDDKYKVMNGTAIFTPAKVSNSN